MIKWILVLVLLLSLVAAPVVADNLITEIDEVVIRGCETSALIGNIGPAIGLFWPMWPIEKLNVVAGPMGAIGNEAVVGGAGVQLPISITVIGIELPIDLVGGGIAYNWETEDIGGVLVVGKTFDVEF